MLFRSHDRALLREVCDEFWLVARGRVEPFDGDLDDYQKWLLDVSRAAAKGQPLPDPPQLQRAPVVDAPRVAAVETPRSAPPKAQVKAQVKAQLKAVAKPAASAEDRKHAKLSRVKQSDSTRPLRVELQRIDERMARLAAEKLEVETLLSRPAASADGYGELGRRLAHISAEVGLLEERWLALHTDLDVLQTGV